MGEICKFDELRHKTDVELGQLIHHELGLGLREARQALSVETRTAAEAHFIIAQHAHATASHLIALVRECADADEVENEARLRQLREMLDGLAVITAMPTPTDDNIASLARALWDARGRPEGSPEDDWFRAERTLKSQQRPQAVCL